MKLGTIERKEGAICLRTSLTCWYPLDGNSGIANDFRETFNAPAESDIGRELHCVRGVLQMESIEQAAERHAKETQA